MKEVKERIKKGIFIIAIGMFFTIFLFNLKVKFDDGHWFLWGAVFVLYFKGLLSLVSAANRKKHDYYFNFAFDLNKINELNRKLNIIDKINKYSPLVYNIILGIWLIIDEADFSTIFIFILYIILYWRGK